MNTLRKIAITLSTSIMLAAAPLMAGANTYTFRPNDGSGSTSDMYDLEHDYLYLWAIDFTLPQDEVIKGATLSISNLYDWKVEPNVLKFHLLDNVNKNDVPGSVDVIRIADSSNTNPANEIPYYEGSKYQDQIRLGAGTAPNSADFTDADGPATKTNYSYSFSAAELDYLTDYLESPNSWQVWRYNSATHSYGWVTVTPDSTFGVGFDPDCHFYNDCIKLVLETGPVVPEPGTIVLVGAGLALLAAGARRRGKGGLEDRTV